MAMHLRPEYIEPHYSTKLWRGYYFYFKENYSESLFLNICEQLSMPLDYIMGDDNWVSNQFLLDFLQLAKQLTNDERLPEKAGEYSLRPEVINKFEYTLLSHLGPYLFFTNIPSQFEKMSLINKCEIVKARPGNFVLRVTPKSDHVQSPPDSCLNNIGVYNALRDIYDLDNLSVLHDKCIHKGDEYCLFEVSYNATRFWIKKAIFAILLLTPLVAFFFLANLGLLTSAHVSSNWTMYFSVLAGFISLFYANRYYSLLRFNRNYYLQSRKKQQDIYESRKKLDRRYKEANLLRELSLRLIREKSSKDVIELCLNELKGRFNYKRAMVMLINSEQNQLRPASILGFEEYAEILYKLSIRYPSKKDNPQLFANILEEGETRLIHDIQAYKKELTVENQILLTALGVTSLVISPIQDEHFKYGLLTIGSVSGEQKLNEDDKHLIQNITSILSLFFQNARSFENERSLKTIFQKYVPSIVMDNLSSLGTKNQQLLSPKNNTITSMFIDLRNFTKTSEMLPPERVVELLNTYIDHITDLIALHGGIIDNLVGDGIVSFFPSCEEHENLHAKQAVICAIDILSKLDNLNKKLQDKGFPKAALGIGLHSGKATIGNVGGRVRVNFTAVGDTVNVAARLQNLCKEYSDRTMSSHEGIILLSESVLSRAPLRTLPKFLGKVHIRGRDDSLGVFIIDKSEATTLSQRDSNFLFHSESKIALIGLRERLPRNKTKARSKKKKKIA